MPWNPEQYNQFKAERQRPFLDLMHMVQVKPAMQVVDLGCGTGEMTAKLAQAWSGSQILGIDSSESMLSQAPSAPNVQFKQQSIQAWLQEPTRYDVIVANASLQWLNHHETLLPQLVHKLLPQGQLAIQMPMQSHNRLNQLLRHTAEQAPYNTAWQGLPQESSVLTLDEYAQLLFAAQATDMEIVQKVYPHTVNSHDELFQFIAGTALIPYLERLPAALHPAFLHDFKLAIANAFPQLPALYAFKRVLLHAVFA